MNKEVTLYDLSKKYNEKNLIGDFRHNMWQRFATIAMSILTKSPTRRAYALQLAQMIKSNTINGVVLDAIIEEMQETTREDEKEALEIVIALKNLL